MLSNTSPLDNSQGVYHALGLNIMSEIPFLDMDTTQGIPEVTIEYGDITETLPDATICTL